MSQNSDSPDALNRRQFLGNSATAAAALSAGLSVSSSANASSPAGFHTSDDSKIRRVGLIGSGWYGKVDLFRLLAVAREEVEVVAVCDVDQTMVAQAAKLTAMRQKNGKEPQTFANHETMLADMDLDIAIVGSPDHWHALHMIDAVRAGADVYVQKPISTDVSEGEAMVAAARKHDRIVQVGTQRRSTPHLLEARDKFITSGRIGKIGSVAIHSFFQGRQSVSPEIVEPPANFDFDRWTGPAPIGPFYRNLHPRKWRAFMEYGNGALGDLCVHYLDLARYFLGIGWPKSISCSGGIFVDTDNVANIPDTQDAVFGYDDLNITWTNRAWGKSLEKKYPWAMVFYGKNGTLKMDLQQYEYTPKKGGEVETGKFLKEEISELERQEENFQESTIGATRRHLKNFINCVKTRQRPVADILEGHISTATCIMANNAMTLGRTLHIDPATGRPTGDKEATDLMARPYREPWVHPSVG